VDRILNTTALRDRHNYSDVNLNLKIAVTDLLKVCYSVNTISLGKAINSYFFKKIDFVHARFIAFALEGRVRLGGKGRFSCAAFKGDAILLPFWKIH